MSGIATGTALAIGLGAAGAGASAASGIYGARSQSDAAKSAGQLQKEAADNSLAFQKQQYNDQKALAAPYVAAGTSSLQELERQMGPGGSLSQQWGQTFQAPTAEQASQTPGYQFALGQGLQGIERGAAARGNLLTGGLLQAEQQYGQGLASQTYQQTFNNALTQYQNAYNQFQQGQANTYNRLAGVAGTGQTQINQLGQQGQAAAGNVANISLNSAQQQGNALQGAAYQSASGYNAAASGISSGLNNAYQGYQLGQFGAGRSGALPGELNLGTELDNYGNLVTGGFG